MASKIAGSIRRQAVEDGRPESIGESDEPQAASKISQVRREFGQSRDTYRHRIANIDVLDQVSVICPVTVSYFLSS